jgi:hypothetical protein
MGLYRDTSVQRCALLAQVMAGVDKGLMYVLAAKEDIGIFDCLNGASREFQSTVCKMFTGE